MPTKEFMLKNGACYADMQWSMSVSDDMVDVWDAAVLYRRHEFLLWLVCCSGVFPDSALLKLACRFIRETPLHYNQTPWLNFTDARSRYAVEVMEKSISTGVYDRALLDMAHEGALAVCYNNPRWHTTNASAAFLLMNKKVASILEAVSNSTVQEAGVKACCSVDGRPDARAGQVLLISEMGNPFLKGIKKDTWKVMHAPCHPARRHRFIVTEDAEPAFSTAGISWILKKGNIVCSLQDSPDIASRAQLLATAPELVLGLKGMMVLWESAKKEINSASYILAASENPVKAAYAALEKAVQNSPASTQVPQNIEKEP